jgi:hypothetical protein
VTALRGTELRGDHTNWWGPNPPAVEGMLRASGFDAVRQVFPRSRAYELARALRRRSQRGRAVFHARRAGGATLPA